jgi:hypothetical protein
VSKIAQFCATARNASCDLAVTVNIRGMAAAALKNSSLKMFA